MPEADTELMRERPGLLLISDEGFASKTFERSLSARGTTLLRPSRKKKILRPGEPLLKKVRQLIEPATTPLRAGSTWNDTAGVPSRASLSASLSACRPWTPRSGTTSGPARRSAAH
ncbi:hypothetical protein NX801_29995 [Streptomyces sp. LP05-1]|uniref:Transposase n=1 Tax=Streptomyces pyxinae TaxID=2970734 RepID=A0ABT2CSY5_9ACTN|nr:hypothetical protein [Streptomyces sp. LP05-1]MCS0639796.1 hypothetical protein [Streptomyces sp. LP05-1]